MRLVALVLALALAACSLSVPSAVDGTDLQCRPVGGGPNCNGDRRVDECAALGLPTAYGLDVGCMRPVRPVGSQCVERWQGTYRCVESGDLLCCNGP